MTDPGSPLSAAELDNLRRNDAAMKWEGDTIETFGPDLTPRFRTQRRPAWQGELDAHRLLATLDAERAARPPDGLRLILADETLFDHWATRTEGGERITVEWGEPDEHGWYSPTFTVHADPPPS